MHRNGISRQNKISCWFTGRTCCDQEDFEKMYDFMYSGRVSAFQTWGQPSDCSYLSNPSPDTDGRQPPRRAPARYHQGARDSAHCKGEQKEAQSATAFIYHLVLYSTIYRYTGQMNYLVCAASIRSTVRNNYHIVLLTFLYLPLFRLRTDSVNPRFLLLWHSR